MRTWIRNYLRRRKLMSRLFSELGEAVFYCHWRRARNLANRIQRVEKL
jgi:hypothetical protein